jgi:NitT/TauT family transport system substrate-binding protein
MLELKHEGRVVLDYDEVDPNGIPATGVVVVRKDFLNAYPDLVVKFLKAHLEATTFINDNIELAMDVINAQIAEITNLPIEEDVLSGAFRRLHIDYEIPDSSIIDFAQTGVSEHLFPRMPDSELTNDSLIRAIQESIYEFGS